MYSYNIKIIALNIQLNQEVISMESSCDESLYSVWCKVFVIKINLKALRHQQLQLYCCYLQSSIFIEQRLNNYKLPHLFLYYILNYLFDAVDRFFLVVIEQ